jgi:hypothetical protein
MNKRRFLTSSTELGEKALRMKKCVSPTVLVSPCSVTGASMSNVFAQIQESELSAVGVRRLLSKLEKAVAKNQDQRSKYPNAPEKCVRQLCYGLISDTIQIHRL